MENKKTIVHVTPYYPPHLGGMENCVKELAENLTYRGYDVKVYTSDQHVKKTNMFKSKNPKVYYLKSVEFAHTPIIFSLFFKLLTVPKNSLIHLHVAHALTPEIVLLVSKFRRIPYVAHVHLDVDPSGAFGFLLNPYKKIFLSKVLKNASKVICLTNAQKEEIVKKYDLQQIQVDVIPNGVGKKYFFERNVIAKNKFHILFVGRLAKQKNIPLLLKSVSLIKNNVIVDIVGEGEEFKNLKKLTLELDLKNVVFHGRKSGNELIKLYKEADLFVMTSKKEGMSLALLEAMAASLPIVCPDLREFRLFLKNSALFFKPNSEKNLAEIINQLLRNNVLKKNLSKSVSMIIKDYKWDNVIEKNILVYKKYL